MQVLLIKYIIINFTFFINLAEVNGLVELSSVYDNVIIATEGVIRDEINKLFHIFKLKEINKQKLKQYSMVHKSLAAITLQYNENLKTISRLVNVDNNIDNTTENFMAIINELLDADENNRNLNENYENMNVYVIKYIDNFLSVVKSFKEKLGVHNNATLNINDDLVKILTEEDNSDISTVSQYYSNITNSNDVLSENDFWQSSGRRIYQGERVKIKYFPFMASIQVFHRFQCSGSIIDTDLIITAASCLQLAWNNRFFRENPSFLSVRIGSSFHNGGGEIIPVLEVYFHPNYNPKNLRHNLCVLRLIRHIKMKRRVKKVKMIRIDKNPWSLPLNTNGITVLGWGAKRPNNILYDTQSQLALAVLDIYPLTECAEVYSHEYVTRRNFCAGFFSKGGGACNRDVGGPGVVNGILAGVISFGSPMCGTPNAPTVFTKLGFYVDWIENIMEMDVPRVKKRTTLLPQNLPFSFPSKSTPTSTYRAQPVTASTPVQETEKVPQRIEDEIFKHSEETTYVRNEENTKDQSKASVEYASKFIDIDTKVTKGYANGRFTVLEPNLSDNADMELEKDVAELIRDIGVKTDDEVNSDDDTSITTTVADTSLGVSSVENNPTDYNVEDEEINVPKSMKYDEYKSSLLKNSKDSNGKSNNHSVMTLFYLSDNDKNIKNKFNDQINDVEGISVETDPFKDLTFRQDIKSALFNFLPEELYKLLVDTIDSYDENKKKQL